MQLMLRRLWQRRWLRVFSAAALAMALLYALLPDAGLYPPEFRFSRTLEDRDGKLLHLTLTADGKYRRYTPLAEIIPLITDVDFIFVEGFKNHGTLRVEIFRRAAGFEPLNRPEAVFATIADTDVYPGMPRFALDEPEKFADHLEIDLPRPDGTPRNLKTGEFDLKPEARAVKVLKAGEPDMGKIVFMPCRPMQPGQPGQPGNSPAPQSPAPVRA